MKKKIVMAFVILHYKNIQDTLECIDSIRSMKFSESYRIIVVDNHSGIQKDVELLEKKADDLIIASENLGFARGNNLGIEKAKEYLPSFITVINNDTILEQTDFIQRVIECYQRYHFHALGPKIITDGGESVNPFPAYQNRVQVEKAIRKSKQLISIYSSRWKRFLLKYYLQIKHFIKKPVPMKNGVTLLEDVSLHGCAIVFSKKYYSKYKNCFYEGTFLYHEEEFLEYRRQRDKLKFVYDPSIQIFHKEGSSLNYNYDDNLYQKMIFREKNILNSLNLLDNIMKNNKKI